MLSKEVHLADTQSIYEELKLLYMRRSAVEQLIRSLECYQEWLATAEQVPQEPA